MGFNPRQVVSNLLEDLSEFQGEVNPWDTPRVAAGKHMRANCTKRLVTELAPGAHGRALEKFITCNAGCERYRLSVDSSWDEEAVGLVKDEIWHFLNPRGYPLVGSVEEILDHADIGPGSNVAADGTDFYTKFFSSRLTTTSEFLYRAYSRHVLTAPHWFQAEASRLAQFGGPVIVEGNRLSFVPKTNEVSRTTCTEPTLNMWCQLGLGNLLRSRLMTYYGIDLAKQPDYNRGLALRGSSDGSFATIDLSSASDTISLPLVRELFPSDFVAWLTLLRSPKTRLPTGEHVPMHMISTMGNGFTFPLQTLIFTACVAAVYRQAGLLPDPTDYRRCYKRGHHGLLNVFGDDIIVRSPYFRRVCHILTVFGFQVNHAKSFHEGPFRESCGLDAFKGVDIRPVFVRTLDTPADRYAYINRLTRWASRHSIDLTATLRVLLKSVRWMPVPPWDNDDSGIQVPESLAPRVWSTRYQSRLYERWAVKPLYLIVKDDRILVPRGEKERFLNPEGLACTFLRGDLRAMKLATRLSRVSYIAKTGIAPSWCFPAGDPRCAGLVEPAWNRLVEELFD